MPEQLSVIIPTLNEESCLAETLRYLREKSQTPPRIIVVDGGSSDGTGAIARANGASFTVQTGGRAAQLNAGAALCREGNLFFLHADTLVPAGYDGAIARTLGIPGSSAGAFPLEIRGASGLLRIVQMTANIRAHFLRTPYGDQGLFVKHTTFNALGGYPLMPFLEDYEFVRRLNRRGRIRIASSAPVLTSPRRWRTLGVVKTTLMNQCIIFGYHIGVPVPLLANWYRGALRRAIAED